MGPEALLFNWLGLEKTTSTCLSHRVPLSNWIDVAVHSTWTEKGSEQPSSSQWVSCGTLCYQRELRYPFRFWLKVFQWWNWPITTTTHLLHPPTNRVNANCSLITWWLFCNLLYDHIITFKQFSKGIVPCPSSLVPHWMIAIGWRNTTNCFSLGIAPKLFFYRRQFLWVLPDLSSALIKCRTECEATSE